MNSIELKIVALLKDLKENYHVTEVKAEFEAEGTRLNELMRLNEIARASGVGFVLKIGGCEAITDIFHAQHLGVTGLIAPMIETPYAMSKYLNAIEERFTPDLRRTIHFGANIETHTAAQNFKDMLNLKKIHLIDTITVGRVDVTGSLGLDKDEINHDKVYQIAESVFSLSKKHGLRTTMGGGIAKEAIPFIKKLVSKKLLDRFETRKIVFQTSIKTNRMEEAIIKANIFELLWLQNKKQYYSHIESEDNSRIEMLMSRIYKLDSEVSGSRIIK